MATHTLPSETSWHPSYLEAVLYQTPYPESRSTADTIVNHRKAEKSRPPNHAPDFRRVASGNYSTFCNRALSMMTSHILPSKTFWLPNYLEAALHQRQCPESRSTADTIVNLSNAEMLTQSSIREMLQSSEVRLRGLVKHLWPRG